MTDDREVTNICRFVFFHKRNSCKSIAWKSLGFPWVTWRSRAMNLGWHRRGASQYAPIVLPGLKMPMQGHPPPSLDLSIKGVGVCSICAGTMEKRAALCLYAPGRAVALAGPFPSKF